MMGFNYRTIVFCPNLCYLDVEEDVGYLEWKHWEFCPNCGSELVHVPIENRPEEWEAWKIQQIEKDCDGISHNRLTALERIKKLKKKFDGNP
jgi:hypothetical protein